MSAIECSVMTISALRVLYTLPWVFSRDSQLIEDSKLSTCANGRLSLCVLQLTVGPVRGVLRLSVETNCCD